MALTIWVINEDNTRRAPLTTQAQADLLVPLMNASMQGKLKSKDVNAAVLKTLADNSMLPDFNGPDSEAHVPPKKGKR